MDRTREAHALEIRKTNRDDIINKRRNLNCDIDRIAEESAKQQRNMIGDTELSDKIDMYSQDNTDSPRRTIPMMISPD